MTWLLFLIALLAGASNPLQSGTNAQLNKQLGQPVWATIFVYASGLAGMLLVQIFAREAMPAWSTIVNVRPWAWFGGLISIAATVAGLTLAHRLGSGTFTGLTLTASLLMSVMLDQFGLLGFAQKSASPLRLAGCALMIGGVWMVARA